MTPASRPPLPFPARPIALRPHFSPRPWGGDRLRTFLRKDAPTDSGPIGESWELSDHPDGRSLVSDEDPALDGLTFGEILRRFPRDMIGRDCAPAKYPLLIKYIDAHGDLSVQVHPDDQWCRAHNHDDRGKSECWFIIDCAPGTRIVYGYKPGVTEADARHAIAAGRLRDLLIFMPIAPGDFIAIPPGSVHAMLAGTMVCEIQQSSNTTFRLDDWDRQPPRALHIDESMQVTQWDSTLLPPVRHLGSEPEHARRQLLLNDFFEVWLTELPPGESHHDADILSPTGSILNVVAGSGTLRGADWSRELRLGDTLFLPAAMTNRPSMQAGNHGLRVLTTASREL